MTGVSIEIPASIVDAIVERAAELVLERAGGASASPYLSVDEAADFLRCSRQRIYDLRSSGRLRRVSEGGRALVLRAELELLVVDEDALPLTAPRRRVA